MGFLIFAFRKLCLKRQINEKNYRLTQLTMQGQRLHDQISVMQRQQAATKSIFNSMFTGLQTNVQQMYSTNMRNLQMGSYAAMQDPAYIANQQNNQDRMKELSTEMTGICKKNMNYQEDETFKKDYKEYTQLQSQTPMAQQQLQGMSLFTAYQATCSGLAQWSQSFNEGWAVQEESETSSLKDKDEQIELEKTSLESQLKELNAELDGVDKAETDAAKKSAPTFGLS